MLIPNLQTLIAGGTSLKDTMASISPIFGFFGGIVALINSVPQWMKLKDIPVLNYGELVKYDMFKKYPQMDQPLGEYFYLKIKKTKGKDIAKSVREFMTIQGTDIIMLPLQWHLDKSPEVNIQDFHYLFLFSFDSYGQREPADICRFLFPHSSNLVSKNYGGPWKEYKDKSIEVKIQSNNAKIPNNPFKEMISNVITKASKMNEK